MMSVRRARDRGRTKLEWLDSRHTFSFGDYYDPRYMGFRSLRVINEDRVNPGAGFPPHSHRDMEIVTYVLEGALAHQDSTGTSSVIGAAEVQRMTAGTGIRHSEYNASATEPVHFLQIWIEPERSGLPPGYEQRPLAAGQNDGSWILVASPPSRDGAVKLHQDVDVLSARLRATGPLTYRLKPGRHGWLHVVRGDVTLNDTRLEAGDGAAVMEEEVLEIGAVETAEVLLFDLA
jgi:redox-sensitive bicupin YhaK (pirin superfamily)